MMEFFISKFWAFMVSIVIMAVLVQGIQLDSRSDRNEALNDMADDLEKMFKEIAAAGVGLETIVHLDRLLPDQAILTMFAGYALLEEGERQVRFTVPVYTMQMQTEQGELLGMDRLVLGPNDSLLMINLAEGPTMTVLSP